MIGAAHVPPPSFTRFPSRRALWSAARTRLPLQFPAELRLRIAPRARPDRCATIPSTLCLRSADIADREFSSINRGVAQPGSAPALGVDDSFLTALSVPIGSNVFNNLGHLLSLRR